MLSEEILGQKGRIFDIQRYSIHDGAGIRTIVFLKGCFFRCRWCCNPESQSHGIEEMTVNGEIKTVGRDVTVREVMETVERDRDYYRRSGGGVTLSGGEMLFQPDFARAILMASKDAGIGTAVESTGCAKWETIEGMLPWIDQFLLDVKHTDGAKHREFTGAGNEQVLSNAARIAEYDGVELSIRVPVIPSFNASPEEIRSIAAFAGKLKRVKRIHLLPYHRLGSDKYAWLGRKYLMEQTPLPDAEEMRRLREAAEEASGLECVIGG